MKNILSIAILSIFVVAACTNTQSGAHTHDDVSTQNESGHDHSQQSNHHQEVFDVEADSTHYSRHDSISEGKEHTHEDSNEHRH